MDPTPMLLFTHRGRYGPLCEIIKVYCIQEVQEKFLAKPRHFFSPFFFFLRRIKYMYMYVFVALSILFLIRLRTFQQPLIFITEHFEMRRVDIYPLTWAYYLTYSNYDLMQRCSVCHMQSTVNYKGSAGI